MKSGQLFPVRRGGYALFGTAAAAAAVVVAGAALASSSVKLIINGNPVTTDARQIGGRTYVPVDDVAKALGLKVYSGGGQIALRPAGGANQVGKLQGKIGEELFTGKYRFIVNSVVETQKYQMKYANNRIYNQTVTAGQNEKLIIVDCRLKNGTALKDEFVFYSGTTYNFGGNTALTSFDETSKAPHAYDVAPDEGSPDGAFVLPGAAIRFAIVFKVTPDTRPKDLVYTIVRYAERTEDNGTTVRVSLAK